MIDNQEPVTGELDDQAIIMSVKESKDDQNPIHQPQDDEEDDEQPTTMMPSSSVLMQSPNNIRCFMELSGLTSQTGFGTITKAIQNHVSNKTIQYSITHFFQRK
ncbi:hypothetical protein ElyMa_005144400 [Elysia marginata]|uniref:Uncharacterized protein n=1 Tax=Elysia marginata TaxID=1093978 RepID=A0AAV4JSI9_9GAST|nr:hypothetical protein ElyMa_005144400 [Elysia marginata]